MLLTRWWSFILGYVVITVEGVFIEKFINMANSRGIMLWDLIPIGAGKLKLKVRVHGFRALRHIARQQKCKIKIKTKGGLPFLVARLEKRKMFVVGAVGFSVILYLLSSFVWFIDMEGMERMKPEQIMTVAEREGLRVGAAKWEFDPNQVEKAIGNLPQVAWVGVQVKGTRVTIEIAEKVLPDVAGDETIPAHLIAAKDGLIKEMLVLAGVPAVKEGDTIQKGQILISGYVFPTDLLAPSETGVETEIAYGEPKQIRAKGIVRARVWYEETVRVPLEERGYAKTGSYSEVVVVKLLDKEIVVRGQKKLPFKEYSLNSNSKKLPQWRNMDIPVEIINRTYYELKAYHRTYTRETALELAVKEAKGRISLFMPNNAKIVSNQITELPSEENSIKIRLTVETLEDIATPFAIHSK